MHKSLKAAFATMLVAACIPRTASADPNCRAILTRDVSSKTDHFDGIEDAPKGSIIEYIHLSSINDDGSLSTFSVHGGGTFPANAVKLLNCHIERHLTEDRLGFKYDTYFDNTPANSKEILRSSVEDKLLAVGIDYADASNASDAYISDDGTACARAVKLILQGNNEMASLISGTGICQPHANVGK